MVLLTQRLGQKPFRGFGILFGRQQKIQGGARGIHRPVPVAPLAPDPDVRFVHAPRIVGGFEPFAQASLQFRG